MAGAMGLLSESENNHRTTVSGRDGETSAMIDATIASLKPAMASEPRGGCVKDALRCDLLRGCVKRKRVQQVCPIVVWDGGHSPIVVWDGGLSDTPCTFA